MQNIDNLTESEKQALLIKLLKENVDIEGLKTITTENNNRRIWTDESKYKCDICGSKVFHYKQAAHFKTINHQKALKKHLKNSQLLEINKPTTTDEPLSAITIKL
jgi:hypothetical protein